MRKMTAAFFDKGRNLKRVSTGAKLEEWQGSKDKEECVLLDGDDPTVKAPKETGGTSIQWIYPNIYQSIYQM